MKTGLLAFWAIPCLSVIATASNFLEADVNGTTVPNDSPSPSNVTDTPALAEQSEQVDQIPPTPAQPAPTADAANAGLQPPTPLPRPQGASQQPVAALPKADEIYSSDRKIPATPAPNGIPGPDKATSLSGDAPDIDSSVRERIEEDSKRIGRVAENLVGVQGDINRVEKEVLGKVFDMSSMKSFLNEHEHAIKEHERLDQEQDDLTKQATSLSKSLDHAINETTQQDNKHRAAMAELSSKVTEDKAVIQGLQKELIPLVEMQKEVAKLPPVNANQTAENTVAVASAQAATEELVYEKAKLKTYKETTANLMKELVKQHDYATKCHSRLYQLNTQIHEVATKEARMKYEQNRAAAKGNAMESVLEGKNKEIKVRLEKAKTNLATINFAKANAKSKIGKLSSEGMMELEKLKAELGKLRQQSSSIETAMMAKISNRKMIEKALRGGEVQIEDMQAKLLAGRLDALRRNNTQMTTDLAQIRSGLQEAQINQVKAQTQERILLAQAAEMKARATNKTQEAQDVARDALSQVVAAKADADALAEKASKATLEAQASMLTKCSVIWDKEHAHVNKKLKSCKQVKADLSAVKATVASLTSAVKAAQR